MDVLLIGACVGYVFFNRKKSFISHIVTISSFLGIAVLSALIGGILFYILSNTVVVRGEGELITAFDYFTAFTDTLLYSWGGDAWNLGAGSVSDAVQLLSASEYPLFILNLLSLIGQKGVGDISRPYMQFVSPVFAYLLLVVFSALFVFLIYAIIRTVLERSYKKRRGSRRVVTQAEAFEEENGPENTVAQEAVAEKVTAEETVLAEAVVMPAEEPIVGSVAEQAESVATEKEPSDEATAETPIVRRRTRSDYHSVWDKTLGILASVVEFLWIASFVLFVCSALGMEAMNAVFGQTVLLRILYNYNIFGFTAGHLVSVGWFADFILLVL